MLPTTHQVIDWAIGCLVDLGQVFGPDTDFAFYVSIAFNLPQVPGMIMVIYFGDAIPQWFRISME
jgi:hypothetical protein